MRKLATLIGAALLASTTAVLAAPDSPATGSGAAAGHVPQTLALVTKLNGWSGLIGDDFAKALGNLDEQENLHSQILPAHSKPTEVATFSFSRYYFASPLSSTDLKRLAGPETTLSLMNDLKNEGGEWVGVEETAITDGEDGKDQKHGFHITVGEEVTAIDGLVVQPNGLGAQAITSPHKFGFAFDAKSVRLGKDGIVVDNAVISHAELTSITTRSNDGGQAIQNLGADSHQVSGSWLIPYGRRIAIEMSAPKSVDGKAGRVEVILLEAGYPAKTGDGGTESGAGSAIDFNTLKTQMTD